MFRALPIAALLALATGCAGPPVPAPVEGLPLCPDFEVGHTRMEGSLRFPVRLRVLDGKTLVARVIISGLRKADDPLPRTFIVDDNAEYTVEWAQCSNERAPRSAAEVAKDTAKAREKTREPETGYECGDATTYKTDKLTTRKGDKASHVIHFSSPPNAACWIAAPAAPGAAPQWAPLPDANGVDAGASPDAGTVVDAGAPPDAGSAK